MVHRVISALVRTNTIKNKKIKNKKDDIDYLN